jgi:hypothetical protein
MQLDAIQKSIIGVLGLTGILAMIAPTDMAPKPPGEKPAVATSKEVAAPAPAAEPVEEYVIDEEDEAESRFGDPDVPIESDENATNNQSNDGYASNSDNASSEDGTEPPMGYIPPTVNERRPPNTEPNPAPA